MRVHDSILSACETCGRPIVVELRGATEGESIVSGLLEVSKNLNFVVFAYFYVFARWPVPPWGDFWEAGGFFS